MLFKRKTTTQNTPQKAILPGVWHILDIENGIKSEYVKDTKKGFVSIDSVKPVFFELDKLLGAGVYHEKGILSVKNIFDELNDKAPTCKGYVYKNINFYRLPEGVRKQNRKYPHEESFYSNDTLRMKSAITFLSLEKNENNTEENTERALQDTESDRKLLQQTETDQE